MTLDQWLSDIYKADIRGVRAERVAALKAVLADDDGLKGQAQTRLNELNQLVAVRGEGACAFSSRYRIFLQEALA